jgi:mannose-6-phosphate isomerase-like protein (cupin superfamily)
MIEHVKNGEQTLAIVIRSGFRKDGIEFFTPGEYSQQLAYMNRPKGYRIPPHVHNEVHRDVFLTQEVLFIRSGRVAVDFYDNGRRHVCDVVLEQGDVILLASGGHGFTMLEPTEMIEVKQGPYAGERDKTRFEPETGRELR